MLPHAAFGVNLDGLRRSAPTESPSPFWRSVCRKGGLAARMMLAQGGEEAGTGIGLFDAARLVDMAGEKETGQMEGVLECRVVRPQAGAAPQEGRQRQHLVAPWRAGPARNRAAGFWRDISQNLSGARRPAPG